MGYYGRDVESMVRELVDNAIGWCGRRSGRRSEEEAHRRVDERLLDLLAPAPPSLDAAPDSPDSPDRYQRTREKMRAMLACRRVGRAPRGNRPRAEGRAR